MTMLDELIERLEKLTGPDREADGEIFALIGGQAWEKAKMRAAEPCGAPDDVIEKEARRFAPLYTTSIDAALTLVPEGFIWGVGYEAGAAAFVCAESSMYREESVCKAANPTIALCIAALKARKVTP